MKKRSIAFIITAAILLGTLTFSVSATINVVEINASIVSKTTLYAGEIFVDGESAMKYLYSDNVTLSKTVMEAITQGFNGFTGSDFASLVPDLSGDITGKGFTSCSIDERARDMGDGWKNAEYAANKYYSGKSVKSSSSVDLFKADQGFAAACLWEDDGTVFTDKNGAPFEICGPLGRLTVSFTDDVTYTVEDGVLVSHKDRHINYTCESVTVIYTSVHLESSADFVPGDINGDGLTDNKDVVTLFRYLSGIEVDHVENALDCNGDGSTDNKDVTVLFRFLSGNGELAYKNSAKLAASSPRSRRAALTGQKSGDGKLFVTVIDFKKTGDGVDMIQSDVDMNEYIAAKKNEFKAAIEKNAPAGSVIDTKALDALFGPGYYAKYAGIEFGGMNYVYSDDFIAIGDEDDFENLYIISGTVTRESRYNVKYGSIGVMQEAPAFTPGDINGDGSVDNKDVVTLFRYLSGADVYYVKIALDCNGDGSLDNKDVTVLFRYLSGSGSLSDKPYESM